MACASSDLADTRPSMLAEPGVQILEQRRRARLPLSSSLIGWLAADVGSRSRTARRCAAAPARPPSPARALVPRTRPSSTVARAPSMPRATTRAAVVELLVARVGIGLQDAAVALEVFAAGARPCGRASTGTTPPVASCAAAGPVVAHVHPQPPGLGPPAPGIEHRHRRVVGVHLAAGQRVAARAPPPAGRATHRPGRPSRPSSSDRCPRRRARRCGSGGTAAMWSQYLATSTCASSAGPGSAARDRSARRQRPGRCPGSATHASLGRTWRMTLKRAGHVLQLLGDVLADLAQLAAAFAAAARLRRVTHDPLGWCTCVSRGRCAGSLRDRAVACAASVLRRLVRRRRSMQWCSAAIERELRVELLAGASVLLADAARAAAA